MPVRRRRTNMSATSIWSICIGLAALAYRTVDSASRVSRRGSHEDTAGGALREFLQPREHLALTLRECARLQSFPDAFQFVGSKADRTLLIGQRDSSDAGGGFRPTTFGRFAFRAAYRRQGPAGELCAYLVERHEPSLGTRYEARSARVPDHDSPTPVFRDREEVKSSDLRPNRGANKPEMRSGPKRRATRADG